MKAIVYDKYDKDPSILNVRDIEIPKPKNDELLIKVKAAAVNPVDWKIRWGKMKVLIGSKMPRQMGVDVAGIIEEVGSDINDLKKGDEIFGWVSYKYSNTFSEYAIIKGEIAAPKPTQMSFNEVAALPMAASTAYKALVEIAKIKKGDKILITGGSGGVGHYAIQIAKNYGAIVHTTVSEKNITLVKKLGADVVYNYNETDIKTIADKFNIVFDTAGILKYGEAKKLLTNDGIYPNIKSTPIEMLIGSIFNVANKPVMTNVTQEYLLELSKLVKAGKLVSIIGHTTPLEKAPITIADLENKKLKISGKLIIEME
mgnify:CR=1 FL=1